MGRAAAYYNEIDPYAADWLRNLIAAGHIVPGDVDERSIEDVHPDDLRSYTQCHFFAGIGVWSYALRRAGWSDDRPVWTGSCPCQPFSAAGKGTAFDDERHLWPAWHWLIQERRPPIVFGEQVASKDAEPWLDLVSADLEAMGFAAAAVAFPSAAVGAPHKRERTYFVADAQQHARGRQAPAADHNRPQTHGSADWTGGHSGASGELGNPYGERTGRNWGSVCGQVNRQDWKLGPHNADASSGIGRLADSLVQQRPDGEPGVSHVDDQGGRDEGAAALAGLRGDLRPGPVNSFWRAADWLLCRDGKWRPVEPGTLPLVDGSAGRMGRVCADQARFAAHAPRKDQGSRAARLRAYGNAINAQQAQIFIEESMKCL
ncbi:DNA cytosine methyltransferase [Achromobacter anxifer]